MSHAKAEPIKGTTRLEPHGYGFQETARGVFVGPVGFMVGGNDPSGGDAIRIGGETIRWAVDLRVRGNSDLECSALQFGFIQKVTRLNARWKWGDGTGVKLNLPTPCWDAVDPRSYWYNPMGIKTAKGCYDPRKPGSGIIDQVSHSDSPRPRRIPWFDPRQPSNPLVKLEYEAAFVTTLVEMIPSTQYQAKAISNLHWAVRLVAVFDVSRPLTQRTTLLQNKILPSPLEVKAGGDPELELYKNTNVAANWRVTEVAI